MASGTMNNHMEKISGIVQRVTYHNPQNGWSVLKVTPFRAGNTVETVTVHQTRVFAGATMEFHGSWTEHPRFGRQFRADRAIEKKPATAAALEKYLGSGLIHGVGPKTAKKIVRHFGGHTLEVFESEIERLTEVEGIAKKKLQMIEEAWREHRAVREVMMFLQGHGISTLFAVRIYKQYGDRAIALVSEDPYCLARDFYGIGFFSADRVALSLGLAPDSEQRIGAAVQHVLAAAREQGHCYLTCEQIESAVDELLALRTGQILQNLLHRLAREKQLQVRTMIEKEQQVDCYYSRSLYFDELYVARRLREMARMVTGDESNQVAPLIDHYCRRQKVQLSEEQHRSVAAAVGSGFSVLTGGPGCGKTTTTLIIVRVLERLGRQVVLAAPTGRAAQRMTEVIGREAKTIHRLLEWQQGKFQVNEDHPLQADFLIVDECSMLDISLAAALLKAVPPGCRVLFIGDGDQLPSVGAGNVLGDIIASGVIEIKRLTRIFRQAAASKIIHYAHAINRGETPAIRSPFRYPSLWREGEDCLFLDSDEATQEQLQFIARVKRAGKIEGVDALEALQQQEDLYSFQTAEPLVSPYQPDFVIPKKFQHVDLAALMQAEDQSAQLRAVLAKVHPWSTLHYNLSAVDTVVRLYRDWIPKYYGSACEIQILSPMTRGSLGTLNLNRVIQETVNPPADDKAQLQLGERIYREGDRVIHRRNNYDLGVFNGDIGRIVAIDSMTPECEVSFLPDGRLVRYSKDALMELDLAYAITIHKSQGSEFPAVILPLFTQHFKMLYRNLLYTGLTRAKKLAVIVGTRRALAMAVQQQDTGKRQTMLPGLLRGELPT